jgi:ApaG protein
LYKKSNDQISVTIEPFFLTKQKGDVDLYVWAYRVLIENHSQDNVVLTERCWKTVDVCGDIKEVRGYGVVGEKPLIKAGSTYEYMSGVPMSGPAGIMYGYYIMKRENEENLIVSAPAFFLNSQYHTPLMN